MWEVLSSSKRDGTGPSNTPHDQSGTGQPSWYQAAGCPSPQVSRLWSRLCLQLRSQSLLHRLECQQPIVILYVSRGPSVAWSILGAGVWHHGWKELCLFTHTFPTSLCGLGTVREVLVEWTVLELALTCPALQTPASFPTTLSKQGGYLGTCFLQIAQNVNWLFDKREFKVESVVMSYVSMSMSLLKH